MYGRAIKGIGEDNSEAMGSKTQNLPLQFPLFERKANNSYFHTKEKHVPQQTASTCGKKKIIYSFVIYWNVIVALFQQKARGGKM